MKATFLLQYQTLYINNTMLTTPSSDSYSDGTPNVPHTPHVPCITPAYSAPNRVVENHEDVQSPEDTTHRHFTHTNAQGFRTILLNNVGNVSSNNFDFFVPRQTMNQSGPSVGDGSHHPGLPFRRPKSHTSTSAYFKVVLLQPPLETFELFGYLPAELRLTIWEMAFPEPRLVEVHETSGLRRALFSITEGLAGVFPEHDLDLDDDESVSESDSSNTYNPDDFALRIACSLPTFTAIQLENNPNDARREWICSARSCEDREPLEVCPAPITLQICHESRAFTLQHYARVQHLRDAHRNFYFNPRRDMLWLTCDALEDDNVQYNQLRDAYGDAQLGLFRSVITWSDTWDHGLRGGRFSSWIDIFALFYNLREVQVILDVYNGEGLRKFCACEPVGREGCAACSAQSRSAMHHQRRDRRLMNVLDEKLGHRSWIINYVDFLERSYGSLQRL